MASIKLLVLCVGMVVVCLELQQGQAQGIGLTLNNVQYTNNSVVNITDIRTDSAALRCTSTSWRCCFSGPPPGTHWYFPNGTRVDRFNTLPYYRTRIDGNMFPPGTVLLHRNPEGTTTGVFRCEILDASENFQSLYVGIYTATTGTPNVTEVTLDRESRTLTCTSTGGPATTVTWTKDGAVITPSTTHQQTQMIVDTVGGIYQNTLTITQSVARDNLYGLYSCMVENFRGSSRNEYFYGTPNITELTFDGQSRTLTCTSTGGRATNVTWTKDGTVITPSTAFQQTKRVINATRGIYHNILNIAQSVAERGLYGCMMENSWGSSNRIELYIYGAPNVTRLAFARESRTLTCTSTGGPATTVTWTKDGTVITPNATHQQTQMIVDTVGGIHQNNLTIAQSVTGYNLHGLYSCMAKNSWGSSNRMQYVYDVGLRLQYQSNHTAYNIQDNSIVRLAALGTLLCTTSYQQCCQNRGQWHYPNGTVVPTSQSGTLLFTSRNGQGILGLQPRTNFQATYPGVDGVYKCQIPDENGIIQTLSAWIYSGPLSVLQESPQIVSLTFVLTSVDDPTFVLTCTSTNRPPTYITWTRDGTQLSDDSIYSSSQSLVASESATYHNTLTVVGRLPGQYRCHVTTEAWESQQTFTQSATKNLTLVAANAPTGLAAEVVKYIHIKVSWTAPTSGALVTGYHIVYQAENDKGRVVNEWIVKVGDSVSEYNITHGLTAGHRYVITVRALSRQLPSPAVGPPTVTFAPSTPTVTMTVSQSSTSLTLTWTQPEGEIVNSYEMVFSYQGPCDSFTHTSTTTVDGTTRQYTLTRLQEFSTYTVNITAANVGGRSAVTSQSVTTRADDPTAAPQTVTASATGPTIVFVTWKHVDCIDRNSEISRYTVRYSPVGGTAVNASVSGTNHLAYTLVGLTPSTNYSIEVAAVNSDGGVGPFSPPIFVTTLDLANTLVLSGTVIPNHSLVLLEDIGESDAQSLLCLTNRTDCCQPPQSPGGEIGNWFFPNGSQVLSKGDGWDFYTNRGPSVVRMHRRRGGVTGIYYCKIPDDDAGVEILYVGVYTNTTGPLEVTSLQFQLTSELNASTPTFTLTCTSTGGPATTVSWTVNSHTVTEDSNHHITSQILSDPGTATYNHTLTVTGRRKGEYECSVSNTKSSSNRSLMVVGATPPTNLIADPDGPTSIKVSWLPPASGATVAGYKLFYRMLGSDKNHVSVDIPANKKQHTLSKLQGGFVYTITMVTKSNHLPSTVTGPIRATLAMVSKVMVRAANATALLVSWDALQDSYLSHYTIYYSAFSPPLGKVVDRFTKVISSNRTSDIVNIRELTAGVEHEFQVTASLEIEGVVYEGVKSVPAKMVIDEAVFQLQMGPVTSCAAWSTNKAEKMESYIHIGIAKIISDRCNCEFQATFIRSGIFHCWNAPDEVTYRSVIVGTGHHNATKLLRFLEEWVNSEPVLQVEKLGLWLSTKCPVKISFLSAPQCPSFRQPPAGGAQCGNVCTCTVRGEHLQTSTAVPKDEGSA